MTSRLGVAVALEITFAVLAFGVRSWIQVRRTGATGLVLPRRGAPAAERVGAVLFLVAIALFVVAPVVDARGGSRLAVLANPVVALLGTVLAVAGIVVCVVAQLTMGESWRIGVDHATRTALVTRGIFGVVRNPIFSAIMLASAGFALLLPNGWGLVAPLVLVAALELQVRFVEEPYLRTVHGADYERYAARAGRFLPGTGLLGMSR